MIIEFKKKVCEKVEIKIKKIGMLWKYHNYGILKKQNIWYVMKKNIEIKKRNGMLRKEIIIEKKDIGMLILTTW